MAQIPRRSVSLATIEADWRTRLQEAQAQYGHALEHHQQTVEELAQCLANGADSCFEVVRAKHAVAFNELVRCEEILVDLLLTRDVPAAEHD